MKNFMQSAAVVAGLLVCCGCVSLHGVPNPFVHQKPVYDKLPVDALRAVAVEIETAVQEGKRDAQIADRDGVVVNRDDIKQAIRTRAARSKLVEEFLDNGYGWEKKDGQLWILHAKDYKKGTTGRQRDRNAAFIGDEAGNRWAIYEGIIDASNFPRRSLPAVEAIFFEVRLGLMKAGQKYEGLDGKPTPKAKK